MKRNYMSIIFIVFIIGLLSGILIKDYYKQEYLYINKDKLIKKEIKSTQKNIKVMSKEKKKMEKEIENLKKDFDIIYIKNVDFYKELAIRATKILNNSKYLSLCEEAEAEKVFCHHDYTYHNIILGNDNSVSVIDFDYCKREVRTFDISNFMIKVLKRNNWNIDFANAIIESYNKVSKLDECEYNVLYAYLQFPQRYWRLANRYYYNEVNWGQNTFDSKLESIINEKDEYLKFLDDFKNEYNTI